MNNIFLDHITTAKAKMIDKLKVMGFDNPLLVHSNVRMHANLKNSTSSYEMKFREAAGANGDDPEERKLMDDDWFFPTMIAIHIEKYDPTDDNGSGSAHPWTYVDENFFTYAAGGSTEANSLRLVYSGDTTIYMHSKEAIKEIHNLDFMYIPDHQYIPAAVSGQANPEYPNFGPTDAERGFQPLHALDMIRGNDGSKVIFNLGPGNNSVIIGDPAATLKNRVVYNIKGWRMTGTITDKHSRACRL